MIHSTPHLKRNLFFFFQAGKLYYKASNSVIKIKNGTVGDYIASCDVWKFG